MSILEGGSHFKQTNTYDPDKGLLKIHVPAHNNIEESISLMIKDYVSFAENL